VWKNVRITVLLLVLAVVAIETWRDRVVTQSWKESLWVGIFPLNGDGTPGAQRSIESLGVQDFAGIEDFFVREARRYGVQVAQPVHIELYPPGKELPPAIERDVGPLAIVWWSLKLRWYAMRASRVPGRAPPTIRLFVLFHDPSTLSVAPDSHGLQKGLVGVVHVFADRAMYGTNNIVIAHELLHTVGATDKYDLASGVPLFPSGYGDRDQVPLYPQQRAEIMAGRRVLSPGNFEMPPSLKDVVVGPETAREIHWTH
jgi:hypothetical protein